MYGWGTYAVYCDFIGQPDHYKPDAVCLAVCFHFCDVSRPVGLGWGWGLGGVRVEGGVFCWYPKHTHFLFPDQNPAVEHWLGERNPKVM